MSEEKKQKKNIISQADIMKMLDTCYDKSLNGINVISPPVSELADDYLKMHKNDAEEACKAMMKNQIKKCTTSGFVTGFGGALTLPVTIPANLGSVFYVQMRMVACIAYMAGFDLKSDQVQTFVYAALAGVSINGVVKRAGVKFGEKMAVKGIEKIPGKVLTKINQRIGMRFITKFGEKGVINLWKLVPVVGAAVNGGFDLVETKAIASRAYKMFFEGDFSAGDTEEEPDDLDIID